MAPRLSIPGDLSSWSIHRQKIKVKKLVGSKEKNSRADTANGITQPANAASKHATVLNGDTALQATVTSYTFLL